MKFKTWFSQFKDASLAVLSLIFLTTVILLSSCGQKETFLSSGSSRYFVQDLNPPYLDILWVIDDRSPMNYVKTHVISEAKKFFTRLDGIPGDYRMGITTMDTLRNSGALRPANTVLTKNVGTVEQRAAVFGNLLSQVINLQTGAENTGLAATLLSLNQYFRPRAGVPLVLVFISDGDDFSVSSSSTQDPVNTFVAQVLSLKGNNPDLVRAYSINYKANGARCATVNNADIDKAGTSATRPTGGAWFQDRYFRLATLLQGETADLCSQFSTSIQLNGLRLKALSKRFKLETPVADPSKLRVTVVSVNNQTLDLDWTYDASTNEVVFSEAPPEGSSIQILIAPN
ncbi:hypothetical protein EBR03_04180 [bacterium]|nr:hypothetical protein [bacterium]NBW98748.1 hypothetical protein [bacterium]NBX82280.1 hypothetical protein [bacterium]